MKKIHSLILIIISSFALSACKYLVSTDQPTDIEIQEQAQNRQQEGSAVQQDNQMKPDNFVADEVMMEDEGKTDDDSKMDGDNQVAENSPKYVDYSPTAIADATKNGGKALLFFHAGWCPTCRSAEKDILENIGQLPNGLTVIKIDYDSEKDLKKKYNITYQHTFVQIDENGEEITKWSGGESGEILKRVR